MIRWHARSPWRLPSQSARCAPVTTDGWRSRVGTPRWSIGQPLRRRTAVFVGLAAPYAPVSSSAVFYIVETAVRRSGVVAPHNGPHMLRHSFAVEALRRGLPLDAIGALMRHRSLDTTLKYAKVDATRLQRLAVAWKEVAPC